MDARIIPNKEKEERQVILGDFIEEMNELAPGVGLDALASVISLPDKEFKIMSELTLNELEKSLNSPDEKLLLIQSLNANGVKAEELNIIFDELLEEVDKTLSGKISDDRISFLKRTIGTIVNAINQTEGIAKRIIPIPYTLCREGAVKPSYANSGDAGLDVFSPEDYEIEPGETVVIPVGIKVAIPLGYELQVRPRSGMSVKTKLRVANTPGTIDSGFRDEIGIIVENVEPKITDIDYSTDFIDDKTVITINSITHGRAFVIGKGQRFAQLVLNEVGTAHFYPVEDVREIGQDRCGGFGSSGE